MTGDVGFQDLRNLAVYVRRKGYVMIRVIAVVTCGLTVAACSASIPSLDFLKSSPPTAALRFESVPTGAEVKASGQTCRTPCELTVQVTELSATFALKGYQPQTLSVHSETSGVLSAARFVPNPVHAELRPVVASANKRGRPTVAAASANPPEPISADVPASSTAPEPTAPSNNTGWSTGDVK
jgi:hypothetical protein